MDAALNDVSAEDILGAEFWTQPAGVLSETFSFMCAQLASVLRDERRHLGEIPVADIVLIERFSFGYAFLRQREASIEDNAMTDRTRREMNKDIIEMLLMLKKSWHAEDKDSAQDTILKKVNKAILNAVKDMPDAEGRRLQSILAESFAAEQL